MITRTLTTILLGCLAAASTPAADSFAQIKESLKNASCTEVKFLSILASDIFDTVDSTRGEAAIARDGRYRVGLGEDKYLNDGRIIYSYSPSTNQVTMQKVDSTTAFSQEVSYLTRLDEFFETRILIADKQYRLVRRSAKLQNLPDSMTVTIDAAKRKIVRLEYRDINDEPVTLLISSTAIQSTCDEQKFVPDFPADAERIKL